MKLMKLSLFRGAHKYDKMNIKRKTTLNTYERIQHTHTHTRIHARQSTTPTFTRASLCYTLVRHVIEEDYKMMVACVYVAGVYYYSYFVHRSHASIGWPKSVVLVRILYSEDNEI